MKVNAMFFLLMICFLLTFQLGFAQESNVFDKIQSKSFDNDWVLFQEDASAKVYTKYADCPDPANGMAFEYVLFKVENLSVADITVYWAWDYTYDNQPRPEESDDEIDVTIKLSALETAEAACNSGQNERLKLFVRDKNQPNAPELTSFRLTDFNVK